MTPHDESPPGEHTLGRKTVWENINPPPKQHNNLLKGSTHGLCHILSQLACFRPDNRHRDFHNLYFVGTSTRPGTGMPTVIVSGRQAAQRIMDDFS